MNKDQVLGKVKQAVGRIKQRIGEALGSEELASQGIADQAKAAARKTWGNARDAVKGVRQSNNSAVTEKAHERQNKLSPSVQNTTQKATERIDEFKKRHLA